MKRVVISIEYVSEFSFLLEDPSECDNVGPCCFGCPMYDDCDHHYEEA